MLIKLCAVPSIRDTNLAISAQLARMFEAVSGSGNVDFAQFVDTLRFVLAPL
jgi:hypothetical protein